MELGRNVISSSIIKQEIVIEKSTGDEAKNDINILINIKIIIAVKSLFTVIAAIFKMLLILASDQKT